MITVIACTVGGIALILTAVAVWFVALVRQEERAELEGERLAAAMGFGTSARPNRPSRNPPAVIVVAVAARPSVGAGMPGLRHSRASSAGAIRLSTLRVPAPTDPALTP